MRIGRRQFVSGVAATAAVTLIGASGRELDVAYINARVWTGTVGGPRTDALGTVGDRIAALGADQVKALSGRRTRVIDLAGAFLMPGIIDAHTHFLRASFMLSQPSLRDANTPTEFTRRIGEAARALGAGQWLQGGNWDAELWGGKLPTRQWIDAVTPNTPVAVVRLDQHMILLNSLALKLAGIDRNTPDVPGGVIVRDAKGEPTGVLKDLAKSLGQRAIPKPSDRETEDALRKGINHALSKGVTQVHTTERDWITQDALRRLRARGETGMRFYSFVHASDWERLAALIKTDGRGDDWVRWGGVKAMLDGSLGSRTALFYCPYHDAPETRGILVTKPDELREWIANADRAALQVATHAIGDEANDTLLDIYTELARTNGPRDRRFRIEHAQHLTPSAITRIARQDIVASVQPYHAIDDGRWAINRIGRERLEGTYAFGSLLKAGAKVSFGSDWPVAPIDPLTGVHAAVLRQTIDGVNPGGWLPEQKVGIEQALTAYTGMGAYAGFQDDRLGRIAPGYIADFAVFDDDITAIDPAALLRAKVLKTVVGGRQRHGDGDS